MNKYQKAFFSLFLFAIITGCEEVSTYMSYVTTPIYISYQELRGAVRSTEPQQLSKAGKIWIKDNYIFINEVGKGIHVVDNTFPSLPKKISFINIPGNYDMAVRGNILYADSYVDLVAIDISNPRSVVLKKRIESILPNPVDSFGSDPSRGVVVDWKIDSVKQEYTRGMGCGVDNTNVMYDAVPTSRGGEGSVSKGGSMARFTLYDDYLYTVNSSDLQVFSIKNTEDPKVWSKVNVGLDIETIYPFKDKLFIGSQTGMYIYNNSNPEFPKYEGEFRHARACDPVVANENYAFVTLRTGNRCSGQNNQLDVIDITNLSNPHLVRSYPMQSPSGLSLGSKNTLYICDGNAGLKVFDITNPESIKSLAQLTDLVPYDVIMHNDLGIVVGEKGIYQYDCSDPKNIKQLSKVIE